MGVTSTCSRKAMRSKEELGMKENTSKTKASQLPHLEIRTCVLRCLRVPVA